VFFLLLCFLCFYCYLCLLMCVCRILIKITYLLTYLIVESLQAATFGNGQQLSKIIGISPACYYSGCGGGFRTRLYITPTTVIRWSLRQRLVRRGWSADLNTRCSLRCRHTPCSSTARGTATAIRGRTLADHIPRRRYYSQLYRIPVFVSRVR